jgi:hypothetical protein
MTSGETRMQKLLNVQKVDLKIMDLETQAEGIPTKRGEWDRMVDAKQGDLASLQAEVEEAKKNLRHLERQVDEKQEDLTKYNAQLPLIKTNREYKAILLEIDLVEKEISDIEEMMLNGMTELEEIEARITAEKAGVAKVKEESETEKAKLAQEQKAVEESLGESRSEREHLASDIDGSLLSQYDRIRTRKGGLAMAGLNDESCDACHLMLPPQVVNEVIGGAVKTCPSCHRLLYWID